MNGFLEFRRGRVPDLLPLCFRLGDRAGRIESNRFFEIFEGVFRFSGFKERPSQRRKGSKSDALAFKSTSGE